MMRPMSSIVDFDKLNIGKMFQRASLTNAMRVALRRINYEHGTTYSFPEVDDVPTRNVVRRVSARVIIEFPSVRPILVLIASMHCQMPSLLR